jgi:hypothetical protein
MKDLDIELIDTPDGAEYNLKGNDIGAISGMQNMPYIAMFGGGDELTTGPKVTEQSFDWWGNFSLDPSNKNVWINSRTEKTLKTTPLTPFGRLIIEEQVKADLQFMEAFATVNVSVSLISVDKLKIEVKIQEPSTNETQIFSYIWNATEQELTN